MLKRVWKLNRVIFLKTWKPLAAWGLNGTGAESAWLLCPATSSLQSAAGELQEDWSPKSPNGRKDQWPVDQSHHCYNTISETRRELSLGKENATLFENWKLKIVWSRLAVMWGCGVTAWHGITVCKKLRGPRHLGTTQSFLFHLSVCSLQCTVKFTVFLFHSSVYSAQSSLQFTQFTILQYNVYNFTIYNCKLQLNNLQPNTRWKFYDLWHGLMELVWQMSHILITSSSKSQISDLPSARWYGILCRNTSHKPTGGKEWMIFQLNNVCE